MNGFGTQRRVNCCGSSRRPKRRLKVSGTRFRALQGSGMSTGSAANVDCRRRTLRDEQQLQQEALSADANASTSVMQLLL